MSLNIRNKTPEQCRTHHQKAMKKYKKIDTIIAKLLPDMKQKLQKMIKAEPEMIKET